MKQYLLAAALALAWSAQSLAAQAPLIHGKRTATITVAGSVSSTCTLSTTPFTFTIGVGYIHSPGNKILKQNALSVRCSKGTSAQIGMNYGLYGSAAGSQFGNWSMKDGSGDYLGYDLCHDNACAAKWGPSGFNYVSVNDKGASVPVWTRIITGQSHAKQGSYSDSITVTISF